ncbi:hypothetical protein MMC07_001436 [Pseudocyphellaria aurata]|nr:hypothetical protein [Pseudocyphellaria aurata]
MSDESFRAPEDSPEYEELFNAASEGDIDRLQAALLPSLNRFIWLHKAESVLAIQFLLAHGAKVDLPNSEGETPLHVAAYFTHPEAIIVLLDAGADINLPTGDDNFTALQNVLKDKNAVTPQQIETIKLLLDRGSDLNAEVDSWGSTLIEIASSLQNLELVRILLARGARPNNALLPAANDYDMTKLLLSQGAKIISAPGKSSAITNAAGGGDVEVLQLLLSHANDAELNGSLDALSWAARGGHVEVVKLLIEYGFDVNVTTKDSFVGETPLLAICKSKKLNPERMAVAKLLIKEGADVTARDQDGKTAAELLIQNDIGRLIQEDPELQKLLAGTYST